MAVSYGGGTTAVAYGTTSLSVALPASGIVAGDYLVILVGTKPKTCLLYTSPSPRDGLLSRMPSSA